MMNTVGVTMVSPTLKVVAMPNALTSHGRKSQIFGMQSGLAQVLIHLITQMHFDFLFFSHLLSPNKKFIFLSIDCQCWKTWCLMSTTEKLITLTNQLQVIYSLV